MHKEAEEMKITGFTHRAANGESFDSIALIWYDNEKYAAELMCANPEYSDIMVFRGGEELRIPWIDLPEESEGITEPETAPWKS